MNIDFTLTIACLIVRSILVEVSLCSESVCFKENTSFEHYGTSAACILSLIKNEIEKNCHWMVLLTILRAG